MGWGMKVCSRHLGHMIAAAPIYGKKSSKSSLEPVDRFPRNMVCGIRDSSPS